MQWLFFFFFFQFFDAIRHAFWFEDIYFSSKKVLFTFSAFTKDMQWDINSGKLSFSWLQKIAYSVVKVSLLVQWEESI